MSAPRRPDRNRVLSIRPVEQMSRWMISSLLISSENTATGSPAKATLRAMLSASADLPMPGRDATTMKLAFWNPDSFSSRSRNPVGNPVMWPAVLSSSSMRAIAESMNDPIGDNPSPTFFSATRNTACSASSMTRSMSWSVAVASLPMVAPASRSRRRRLPSTTIDA